MNHFDPLVLYIRSIKLLLLDFQCKVIINNNHWQFSCHCTNPVLIFQFLNLFYSLFISELARTLPQTCKTQQIPTITYLGPPFRRGIGQATSAQALDNCYKAFIHSAGKILYGLCPKLHFQNACPKLHKRSKLRSYGGTYRKQFLCSFTFELKKKKKNLVPKCTCVMDMGTIYRKVTSQWDMKYLLFSSPL